MRETKNFLGVKWTKEGTRIMSVNGTEAIEIQETQLGTPVTAKENIKIPTRQELCSKWKHTE